MDLKMIKAIEKWRPPNDVHEVRFFLGLANYYRRFLKGYSEISRPLRTSRRTETWDWSQSHKDAEESNMTDHILTLPEMSKPFLVEIDTSDFTLRGVLIQDGYPVAFEIRKLKDMEKRYPTHEKELLVVIH